MAASQTQINTEICRALGLTDLATVRRVSIILEPDNFPTIKVERFATASDADALRTVCEVLRLVPAPAG